MIDGIKKVSLMNENSKREFMLNFITSNVIIARQGGKERTLLTMKFNTLYVCQNACY